MRNVDNQNGREDKETMAYNGQKEYKELCRTFQKSKLDLQRFKSLASLAQSPSKPALT